MNDNEYSSSDETSGYDSAIPQSALDQSTTSQEGDGRGPFATNGNIIFLGVLMGMIVFVATLLIVVVIPQLFEWLRRRSLNSKKVLKKRQKRIHQWLITKSIPHPSNANKIEGASSEKTSTTNCDSDIEKGLHASSDDTNNNTTPRECMICMEDFCCGESVSWSLQCDHVFHNTCLTEWLLQHTNCPYCRQRMVPDFDSVSNKQKQPTRKEIKQMQVDRSKRSASTMYTLEDGFVVTGRGDDTENDEDANSRNNPSDYVEGSVVRNDDDDKDHVSENGALNNCCSTKDNGVADSEKLPSQAGAETEKHESENDSDVLQSSENDAPSTRSVED